MIRITADRVAGPGELNDLDTRIDRMPLYGTEKIMGEDDSLPFEGESIHFRLKDDDGEIMYEGRLTDDDECINQAAALRWGEAMAGCTIIEVSRNGKWEVEIG